MSQRGKWIRPLRLKPGDVFTYWTVQSFDCVRNEASVWICKCRCGTVKPVLQQLLLSGKSTSCGCRKAELVGDRARIHGAYESSEYGIFVAMKDRCHNENNRAYKHYGGRGIIVCDEWRDNFPAFLAHVGRRPGPKYSIDRFPDKNGNYEPGNVRWTTQDKQMRNRRNNVSLEINGEVLCVEDIAARFGLCRQTITKRIRAGLSQAQVLKKGRL